MSAGRQPMPSPEVLGAALDVMDAAADAALRRRAGVPEPCSCDEALALRDLLAKLRALFPVTAAPPDDECCDDACARCGQSVAVDDGYEWEPGEDVCHDCAHEVYAEARNLLAVHR